MAVRFGVVTAAYNEEVNLPKTLESVASQTCRPDVWIIVSDGSTDRTDAIVRDFAADHDFIRMVRREKRADEHSFGAKVRALNTGLADLDVPSLDFVGVLDADISFPANYFADLLAEFEADPKLGVGGGLIVQCIDGRIERRIKGLGSVAGAVQLFRREAFAQTGGFRELEHGGEDAAMEIVARMHGWKVRTFPGLEVIHYGLVGKAAGGRLRARYVWGQMNYGLGYHLLFEISRCVYRTIERPYLFGSVAELWGFFVAWWRCREPQMPKDVVRFLRREQMGRLLRPRA